MGRDGWRRHHGGGQKFDSLVIRHTFRNHEKILEPLRSLRKTSHKTTKKP